MSSPPDPNSPTPPTPPTTSVDWERIGRYLAGESSADEAAAVGRWLEEHPADAQVVAALDSAATHAAAAPQVIDVDAALQRVKARARSGARRAAVRFVAFAAVAATMLLAAVLVPWDSVLDDTGDQVGHPMAFETQVGERDSVMLPDSSLVVLGPRSTVKYAARGEGRLVDLDGQAYFRVAHERRTFTVRTRSAVVRDIGTAFSVLNSAGEAVRVVVHEGIVEVKGRNADTLRVGDVAAVNDSGVVQTTRGAATADDTAWMRGQLVFRDKALTEIAADLRRWYGVELRVTDSALMRRHFTGTFVTTEPARTVVAALALAIGAQVDSTADTLILRSARALR